MATSTPNLECRMYEARYPEVDQAVMIQVKDIADMGAYVSLLEYNNIEGMILFSELSRRRIKSVNCLIRVGPVKDSCKEMGDVDMNRSVRKVVFVTVGTTCFDALVRAVDSEEVRAILLEKGYTDLLIQLGRGSFWPSKSAGENGSLVVDYFTFSPSIADHLRTASLVISHAGSGSIFETLHLGKPLIVVVNEDLMDNHQCELADELAERKHLLCARPQTLYRTLENMDLDSILPYPPSDASAVAKILTRFLGFPSD